MPDVSDHLVKSLIRLVRQSTTVPNTSNTSAFTADTSDMRGPPVFSFRHSGAMRSIEPGISRFQVWSFGPSRNDGSLVEMELIQLPVLRLDVAHRAGDRAHHHRFGFD